MEWKQRNIRLRRSESLHCWNKYTMWSYDTERKLLIFLQHNDKEPTTITSRRTIKFETLADAYSTRYHRRHCWFPRQRRWSIFHESMSFPARDKHFQRHGERRRRCDLAALSYRAVFRNGKSIHQEESGGARRLPLETRVKISPRPNKKTK